MSETSGRFVVFSMPRSRSAWLARFLSYGDWHCGHDEIRHFRSLCPDLLSGSVPEHAVKRRRNYLSCSGPSA